MNALHDLMLSYRISPAAWCGLTACLLTLAAFGQPLATNSPLATLRARLTDRAQPLTWVFTGDSITHGAKHTHGARGYVEHFAERIRWEMGRGRDLVINSGLSGEKADGLLRDFDWRVARFQPAVVSLLIGMNDCLRGPDKREEFRAHLRQFIDRSRALGAVVLLHTPNPIDVAAAPERRDLPAYAAIIAEVAREQHTLLVDHWQHWQTACATPEQLACWLNDPIHPNARGHREMAILTFQTLDCYSTNSPTCQPTPSPLLFRGLR